MPIISTQISPTDRALLDQVCFKRGELLSSFVRRAIKKEMASLGFYDDFTRQALGIKEKT